MSDEIKTEIKRVVKTPAFLVVGVILLAAALGLNASVQALGLYFKKERVELRAKLDRLPARLGPWQQLTKDQVFPLEIEHALGTKDYISRWYVDTRRINPRMLEGLQQMSTSDRQNLLGRILRSNPEAVLDIHMAYYTGLVDTVAHVPERCMVGGGFDVNEMATVAFGNHSKLPGGSPLKVSYIEFRDRERASDPKHNVAYFFQVNGAYESNATTGVRVRLQDIREKFAYYCKVELRMILNDQSDLAKQQMDDFLSHAVPEMEKLLPDWKAVTGRAAE